MSSEDRHVPGQPDIRDHYAPPVAGVGTPVQRQKTYGCRGAGIGGCLVPFVLLMIAAASGDIGGPLFWPIIAFPLGILGMIIGLCFKRAARPRERRRE